MVSGMASSFAAERRASRAWPPEASRLLGRRWSKPTFGVAVRLGHMLLDRYAACTVLGVIRGISRT